MSVSDVLVGDVWIMAGQSNMEGIGNLKDALPPIDEVRAYYMRDEWDIAKDPVHKLSEANAEVHWNEDGTRRQRNIHKGVGPAVSFGQEMFQKTGVPQGLIACAHGGTSMAQWSPKLKNKGNKSLYGAMLKRFERNGSKVAGIIWYQGCSDTHDMEVASAYTANMEKFVEAVRKDFKSASLPFIMVQISRKTIPGDDTAMWNSIQDQQRLLPEKIKKLTVVRLGKRLAYATMVVLDAKSGKKPIAIKNIKRKVCRENGCSDVVISFDNVVGKLCSQDRPTGFTFIKDGQNDLNIYKVTLDKNQVILHAGYMTKEDFADRELYYITDEADRSLPAFGPLKLFTDS
jgi:sialate O-acetylesterase